MKGKTPLGRFEALSEAYIHIILAGIGFLVRLPFLKSFQLVTYDGTYYLGQARSLLSGTQMASAFPIGYPALVAFFNAFVKDTVIAAQIVSLLAGVGSVLILYLLARHYVHKYHAFLCALLLAVHPLFIRFSLVTMSESLYTFWILLSLLLFVRRRFILFGLTIGLAAITRPEAVLIAGILTLSKLRWPKQFTVIIAGFVFVFSINAAVLSWSEERLIIVPKTANLGVGAKSRVEREATLEFEGREEGLAELKAKDPEKNLLIYYFKRLPGEFLLVVRYLLPVLFLLSLFGAWRKKKLVLLAPLVFFLLYPLATKRSEDRFILPYIPMLLVFAFVGVESIGGKRVRSVFLGLVLVSAIGLPIVNSHALNRVEERSLIRNARDLGGLIRTKIQQGAKIADRKPYFAFYAGGQFVKTPLAPYDKTIQFLCDANAKYLFLEKQTIEKFRPALIPLLYDKATLAGEMRFEPIYFGRQGDMILEKIRDSEPLAWEKFPGHSDDDFAPFWSPDGRLLAFRSRSKQGYGWICVASSDQDQVTKIVDEASSEDQIAWSPDGKYIAYSSSSSGTANIFLFELATKRNYQITSGEASDQSPSWSRSGSLLVFSSNRTGQNEIWLRTSSTGEERQLTTDGGNTHPAVSPTGERVVWIKQGKGVVILDQRTGVTVRPEAPRNVAFAPAWSPDGKYLAVTACDWGSWDIYLIRSDGRRALLLTKDLSRQGMPNWRSDGRALAINSDHDGKSGIWILSGLGPYLSRLDHPKQNPSFGR
jgi:hypothetical protein